MFPSSAASGHVPSHGQGLLVEDHMMVSFYSQQFFPNITRDLNSTSPPLDQQPFGFGNCPVYHDHDASLGGGHYSNCQISFGNNQWPWGSTSEEAMFNKNQCRPWGSTSDGALDRDCTCSGGSSSNAEGLVVGGSARRKKVMKGGRRKMREPRFCFKTMSEEVDVLDDGYKWRKYGQKTVKDTHHPRSYYRCARDNCRVKKRVERLAEDPRMVITTYEGRHVHSPPDVVVADGDVDILLQASSQIGFFR